MSTLSKQVTTEELLSRATALPWQIVKCAESVTVRLEDDGGFVEVADCGDWDNAYAQANAELIVRAVNSFAAMREALQAYVDSSADSPHTIDDARALAEKALALANNTGH